MRGSHVLKHFSPAFARQTRVILSLLCMLSTPPNLAFAWVYPEHREITLRGIQKLDPHRKALLDTLWAAARVGYESRLSITPGDVTSGESPGTIDYAAWPAIARDHSTSAANLLEIVLEAIRF